MLHTKIDDRNIDSPHEEESCQHDLRARGYSQVYRENQVNNCPGCGHTQWYVGRISAECGYCATALPLQDASARGGAAIHTRNNRPVFFHHAGRSLTG